MDWFLQRLSGAGCGCEDIGIGPKCSIDFRGLFFLTTSTTKTSLRSLKDLIGFRGALYAVDIHGLSSALNAANRPIILSCPSLAL